MKRGDCNLFNVLRLPSFPLLLSSLNENDSKTSTFNTSTKESYKAKTMNKKKKMMIQKKKIE